jgi:hypothetical protein
MTTTTGYDLRVTIVDHVDNEGADCEHCQLEDTTVQAQAYVTLGESNFASSPQSRELIECCLACLIPAIDSTPYVDTDCPIVVEVARSATRRPF